MRPLLHHLRATALLCALTLICACQPAAADDEETIISDMGADLSITDQGADLSITDQGDDLGADMEAADLASLDDAAPDLMADVCEGVACGPHGTCEELAGAPSCRCNTGFEPAGLGCAPAPAPPSLVNLPGAESSQIGQPDSFQLMVNDPNGDAVTLSVAASGCPFDVEIDAANALRWTCSDAGVVCEVTVRAADPGGLSDSAALFIACLNSLPTFSSTPPTSATEHVELRYPIACADPDGSPVTLAVANDDTCGGAIRGGEYVFTPDETQGGAMCLMHILCSDGAATEGQSSMITVSAINEPPTVSDVTISPAAPVSGQPLTCHYTFSDPDGDPDASIIEWLIDGQVAATGPTLTTYAEGDAITCRVIASDGSASSPPADAPAVLIPSRFTQISAGQAHTCVIRAGALYCWGENANGQLGDGTTVQRSEPTPVINMGSAVTHVAAGSNHTCAIKAHALYCWGSDASGQLGFTGTDDVLTPQPVSTLNADVSAVSAGNAYTCAIRAGVLYCWGLSGRWLGQGAPQDNVPFPQPVPTMTSDVTDISCGQRTTCAIQAGALYCWGERHFFVPNPPSGGLSTPYPVLNMASDVEAVTVGWNHTCAIQAGALYCWSSSTGIPTAIMGMDSAVSAVSAGQGRTCAIRAGATSCWGDNSEGLLGDSTTSYDVPVVISGLETHSLGLSVGQRHSCVVQRGAVRCWGDNPRGQLGLPRQLFAPSTNAPLPVLNPSAYAVNNTYICATQAGAALCWGKDPGRELITYTPAPPPPTQGSGAVILDAGVTAIDINQYHACAIKDGAAYCWGNNTWSQSAPGWYGPNPVPNMGSSVEAIATGWRHSCAIKAGRAYCWGDHSQGALGSYIASPSSTPVAVPLLSQDVTALAAGSSHTCAISAGTLYCWGGNSLYQRGEVGAQSGNYINSVLNMETDVAAVATGNTHTCAIKAGALYCWGSNQYGQLGNGNVSPTPIRAATLAQGLGSGVTALALGTQHSCAIKAGALYCWGRNHEGQLGDMAQLQRAVPTLVPGMDTGVSSVEARDTNTCALKNGQLHCWGNNFLGHINGDNIRVATPAALMFP